MATFIILQKKDDLVLGKKLSAKEEFGVEPICSIRGTTHVVRKGFDVASFIDELACPLRRFSINRFQRAKSKA